MKKLIATLTAITLIAGVLPFDGGVVSEYSITANAATVVDSGTCGENLTWTLDEEGTLTISGTGDMTDWESAPYNPWYNYNETIESVIIENGVTSIGNYAFYWCTSLESITIPDSVTSISEWAFYYCTSLTSITIPDSVTSIGEGEYALYGCSSLTSINVNSNNQYYSDIEGVLFNKDKTKIICYPAGKDDKEYVIPDSVTSIGSYAFCNCLSLTSITIPDSVTSIDMCAFCGCSNLESVTIPDSVTSIGGWAFSGCTSLSSITIPDSVTSIGNDAFRYCTSLTSVTIPDSVTSIGNYAFKYCSSLTSVTIPDSVTSIGKGAFYDCTSLESITILNPNCEISDYSSTISNGSDENSNYYFNGTIYGYEGSTAQTYAENYGYKFEALSDEPTTDGVCGDANDDGEVKLNDAVLIMQAISNPNKFGIDGTDELHITEKGWANSDCNAPGDGVTGKDALAIQKLTLQLIDSLPEI